MDTAEDDWSNKEIHLDLSGFQSSYITSRIYDLAALHTLNLSNNRITKLSDQLSYLNKLQVLNLRNNRLTFIPKEIEDCKFLRIVYLGGNLLTTLPGSFFLLGRMNELEVSDNPMVELPIITGDMKLLKILKDWEVGVSAFKQLKHLSAAGAQLVAWPPQIDRIAKLEHLDLSRNALVRAPESLARNNNLTFLDMSYNKLVSLPVEIYGLPLQILKVNNNKLTEMPDPSDIRVGTFVRGEHLVELDITENSIEQLSAWVAVYSSLSRFYGSLNRACLLSQLMGGNVFVRELDLNRNMLYKIPAELSHCTLLVKLYLNNNQLAHIPPELGSLTQLEEFRLSDNMLTEISGDLFERMMLLKVLTLENNLLSELPLSLFALPSLIFLDASYNRLLVLPEEVRGLEAVRTLLLSDNLIPAVPASIADCGALEIFEMHNNKVASLPITMSRLQKLRRLTLSGNLIGPKIPPVLSEMPGLPFYNISNNSLVLALKEEDPVGSFSSACTDLREIKVFLNAVWGDMDIIHVDKPEGRDTDTVTDTDTADTATRADPDTEGDTVTSTGTGRHPPPDTDTDTELHRDTHTVSDSVSGSVCTPAAAAASTPAATPTITPTPTPTATATVGAVCSLTHGLTAAYFPPTRGGGEPPAAAAAAGGGGTNGGEALGDYGLLMADLVANARAPGLVEPRQGQGRDEANLAAFADPDLSPRGGTSTCHGMEMSLFEFPPGNTHIEFMKNVESFGRFSKAARALHAVCTAYNEEYCAWKLKLTEPEPEYVSVKSMNSSKNSSSKGKPKAPSFKRGRAARSANSAKEGDSPSPSPSVSAAAAEGGGEGEGGSESPSAVLSTDELAGDDKAGDGSGDGDDTNDGSSAKLSMSMPYAVTAAAVEKAMMSPDPPSLSPSQPAPPEGAHLPLLSEVVMRSMLEQRQSPQHDGSHSNLKTIYPSTRDPVQCLLYVMECYNGLGTSLVRISDFLCSLLRTIEDRGAVDPSCLSLAQRLNDDFDDLLGEKAAGFARKKSKAPGAGSASKAEDILAQVESMSTGKKGEREAKVAAREAAKAAEAAKADQRHRKKSAAVDPSLLDHGSAARTVTDIERNRRRVTLLAAVYLDRALFVLKSCGWDAKSMKMQNAAVSPRRAVHHFEAKTHIDTVVHVGYYYARALQRLRICTSAVREYYAVLSIGPLLVWHPLQMEIVKCYLDMGEYLKAEELLYKIIEDSPSLSLRSDKTKELGILNTPDSNLSREVRMLGAMLSSGIQSIHQTGVGSKEQLNRFEMETNGVLHRRPLAAPEILVGRTDRLLKQIQDIKDKEKAAFAVETVLYAREEMLVKVEEATQRALAVTKEHEDFLAEMGPIVMPE
jgi:Leucine-rich repeat (LRR) protein